MRQRLVSSVFIGIAVSLCVFLFFLLGIFETWQFRFTDSLFHEKPVRNDIAIIAIDDASIASLGRFPWDREKYAKLLDVLGNKPRVVGFDVSFSENASVYGDEAFARVLEKKTTPIVLPIQARKLSKNHISDLIYSLKFLGMFAESGLVNMLTDGDQVTRKSLVSGIAEDGSIVDGFIVKILQVSKMLGDIERVPHENDGGMRIAFFGKNGSFPTYSFSDVLSGKVDAKDFLGKIVLIGATAPDLHDTFLTPVSSGVPMPGVVLHAFALQTVLNKEFLLNESRTSTLIAIVLLSVILSLVLGFVGLWPGLFVTGVSILGIILFSFYSFDQGVIRYFLYPLLACLGVFVVQISYKYISEEKTKQYIKKAFSYYVSEPVLQEILKDPKKLTLGGERKQITVLFSDIAGFTSISETLEPDVLAGIMNEYLTRMTRIVFSNNGVLDKYIGDAVMAFWNAPISNTDHAFLACKTAIEMQKEIVRFAKDLKEIDGKKFHVRIGMHTGDMVVGNMGSESRFDYTLLGDNVNLGSRLEGINKQYGTSIIISEDTYVLVKDRVQARKLDTVAVKGKKLGVTLYELVGFTDVKAETEKVTLYEKALDFYMNGKFKEAYKAFSSLKKIYPEDGPTQAIQARLAVYVKHPPKHWDGVYHAESK
ncbi:adenylate/guanylate cyclase domain-containing protein [Candidatus Gottesmanbacteria bacterium]|nr:adenylate/guanylate cyclase domain-containing protein [Candidatus Gottesmanbacteria bacterium]